MTEPIKMIEIFSGIGAQAKALDTLPIPHEVVATMDVEKDAILSYAAMRYDLDKEIENYDFPSKEDMVSELQQKNIGFDFQKSKHTITIKTNENKVKQYYIADKLSKNLGDVSLCKELPYVDIIFHSSPCQSFSCAGKGEGGDEGSGTTSSLMWESLRLIGTSMPQFIVWENVAAVLSGKHRHNFIKYLERLSEMGYESAFELLNSKNYGVPQNRLRIFCVSRKIKNESDCNATIRECKSSNKQVINTMKEIRENHPNIKIWEDFTFPEPIPLTTRLKDILEHNVDEKYYLPDDRIEKILNSSFMQEKKRVQTTDVYDTLLARDWKDPKCVPVEEPQVKQIGNVCPTKTRSNPNQGRVYDKEGIAPALTTMEGGNREPMVIDEIKVVGNYMPSNHDASRVVDVDGIAPTVKENHGTVTAIAEPQADIKERFFRQVAETILENQCEPGDTIDAFNKKVNHSGICPTVTTRPEGFKTAILPIVEEQELFIVASRGRNPENPSDRTTGAPTEQRLEPNFSGTTNCLTSVQKDNYVCEPQVLRAERTEYGKAIRKQYEAGEIDEKIGNMRELKPRADGISNTITTLLKDNYVAEPIVEKVAIVEDQFPGSRDTRIYKEYSPTLRQNCNGLKVANGEEETEINPKLVGGIGEKNFGKQYRQGNRIYDSDEIAMALNAQPIGNAGGYSYLYAVEEEQPKIRWRIRKLTPKECIRLMNFTDRDYEAMAKYVSNSAIYKAAGNSIVVACLIAIFSSLFLEDGYKSDIWTKYSLNYWD